MPAPFDATEKSLRAGIANAKNEPTEQLKLIEQLNRYLALKDRKNARAQRNKRRPKAKQGDPLATMAPDDSDEPFILDDPAPTPPPRPLPPETPEATAARLAREAEAKRILFGEPEKPRAQSAVALEVAQQARVIENGLGWSRQLQSITPLELPHENVPFINRPFQPGDDRSSLGPNGASWNPFDAETPVESITMVRDPESGSYEYETVIREREAARERAENDRRASMLYGGGRNMPW